MEFAPPLAGRLNAARDGWAKLRRLARDLYGRDWHAPRWRRRDRPRRGAAPAIAAAPVAAGPAAIQAAPAEVRADWSDRLWDGGFTLPGGEAEILRLTQLLPLSPATTLLLAGRDAGGAARCIAEHRRAWIAAHQHDPVLAARMATRLRPLGKRAVVQPWDPAAPAFRARYHHHALVLEALQSGASPEALCLAVAAALKPGGQLVLVDTVAGEPQPGLAKALERWLVLDGRVAPPPSRTTVEAALQAAGFTLHVTESIGARQAAAATEAWTRLLGSLREAGRPASGAVAAALVTEAEAWLLRQKLLGAGALVLLRWHASLPQ